MSTKIHGRRTLYLYELIQLEHELSRPTEILDTPVIYAKKKLKVTNLSIKNIVRGKIKKNLT